MKNQIVLETMKSTVKGFIWVALIVLATFSKAGVNDPMVNVKVTGVRTFSLSLQNSQQNVQALLKDQKGHVLVRRAFRDGISKLSFDLNSVRDGIYKLELVNDQQIQTIPVDLASDHLNVDTEGSEVYFFPVVYQKGDLVTVSKWAPVKEQIYVTILDAKNRLVHEDVIKGAEHLAKRFDFSEVQNGDYEIRISCNNQIVSKEIHID